MTTTTKKENVIIGNNKPQYNEKTKKKETGQNTVVDYKGPLKIVYIYEMNVHRERSYREDTV